MRWTFEALAAAVLRQQNPGWSVVYIRDFPCAIIMAGDAPARLSAYFPEIVGCQSVVCLSTSSTSLNIYGSSKRNPEIDFAVGWGYTDPRNSIAGCVDGGPCSVAAFAAIVGSPGATSFLGSWVTE